MNRYSTETELPSTMTVVEMARYLGISRAYAYTLVKQSDIPRLRLGERILIPTNLFLDWIKTSSNEDTKSDFSE